MIVMLTVMNFRSNDDVLHLLQMTWYLLPILTANRSIIICIHEAEAIDTITHRGRDSLNSEEHIMAIEALVHLTGMHQRQGDHQVP